MKDRNETTWPSLLRTEMQMGAVSKPEVDNVVPCNRNGQEMIDVQITLRWSRWSARTFGHFSQVLGRHSAICLEACTYWSLLGLL